MIHNARNAPHTVTDVALELCTYNKLEGLSSFIPEEAQTTILYLSLSLMSSNLEEVVVVFLG